MSVATGVLDLIAGQEPTQPRLTWYGADEERVELSGRVLTNWVTKATNLLLEDAEVEPGTRVLLDVPVHWRALVWGLATWAAGGNLLLPGETSAAADDRFVDDGYGYGYGDDLDDDLDDEGTAASDEDEEDSVFVADAEEDEPEIVVTARPSTAPAAGLVLAIALPALARQVEEAIPAGAVDAAASLLGYADELGYVQEPADGDIALSGAETGTVSHGDLDSWVTSQTPAALRDAPGARALCAPASLTEMLAHAVATWREGGSLVLLGEDVPRERFEAIAAAERATVRC